MIWDDIAAEQLFEPETPTGPIPVVPSPDPTSTPPAAPPAQPGLVYSRFVPDVAGGDALTVTEEHVRAHLSAVADADDDPGTRAGDVHIEHRRGQGGWLIVGHLDATPDAPYLAAGHDPFAGVDPALLREVLGGAH